MDYQLLARRVSQLYDAGECVFIESIQSLWSGYGEIVRFRLRPDDTDVVVKYVCPPRDREHKYGWAGDVSHQRKLSSYRNELAWYRDAAADCDDSCRVAKLLASESTEGRWLFVFEDLDASGYPVRAGRVSQRQLTACLSWLASFHARFISDEGSTAESRGLWPVGTYWHLATRPEEFAAMPAGSSGIQRRGPGPL